jgi:hypothetical protein
MRVIASLLLTVAALCAQPRAEFRPPAVPLVTHDPYFSIWSTSNDLTDQTTKHWTGIDQALTGVLRIDGKPYRFMGTVGRRDAVPEMKQVSLEVLPTRTVYVFEEAGVRLSFTFFTPAFPQDLDVLSRPVTYLDFDVRATDSKPHQVAVYIDASAWIATNTPDQRVVTSSHDIGGLRVMRAGTAEQPILQKSGDNLRIDWGYVYLAVPNASGVRTVVQQSAGRDQWLRDGALPAEDDLEWQPISQRNQPRLMASIDLGSVSTPVQRHAILAYDDIFSVQYFHRNLRPYWRRNGMGIADLLRTSEREFPQLLDRAKSFDKQLMSDLVQRGGEKYADIAALAFRQTLAAHKLVADLDGTPLYMSKENFSNGSIDTVDVTYPSSPFFLYFNPVLLKGQLIPILQYASMPRWPWPYAPHDLGTYPLANGQTYGGGERSEENQMPVEESGNLLILVTALAQKDGNANFALKYWPVLEKWAGYLRDKGLDPENQLSTDDFAGHLAHNTNLSIKAILALAGYGRLCEMAGKSADAKTYTALARQMATKWVAMANDGDHFRLAFDKPGTWSQKYNLVWDRILGLNVFPAEVARKEVQYYLTKQNRYGLPLDNRETYTKLDWIVWTATLTESKDDFRKLIEPVYDYLNESPSRVPMSDWYWTLDGRQRGFQARSVVGGVFIPMLTPASR